MKYRFIYIISFVIFPLFFNTYSSQAKNNMDGNSTDENSLLTITNAKQSAVAMPEDSIFMTKKQYKRLFYEATGYFFDNHFQQALPLFIELLKVDPDNAHINFYVGACYMNLPEDKSAAIPFLQKACKNTTVWYDYDYRSNQAPVFAYFYLANVYKNNYKVGDAIISNKIFKSFVSQENEPLMSEVDREIKGLEGTGGGMYAGPPEFSKTYNKLLTDLIQYDSYIRNPEQDVSWWVNNLEGIKRELLVNDILNVAYSGTVTVFDNNNRALTNEQVKSLGNEPVLKRIQVPTPPYNDTIILIENQINRQLITKIRFQEEWYYDDQTMQIGKKVVGYTPLIEEYTEDNVFKGYKPLFTIYFDQRYPSIFSVNNDSLAKNPVIVRDSLGADTTTKKLNFTTATEYTTIVKGQTFLTERIRYDVPVNNMVSKLKPWIENMDNSKRDNFLAQLFDLVSSGIIQTYDIFDDSLSVKKVREILQLQTDTVVTKSKIPPYRDTVIISTTNRFDYNKVAKFRFMEEWYLNEKTSDITKKIVGFAPLVEIFDENKSIKGFTTLFWVYFDKKYPVRLSKSVLPNFKPE